MAPAPPGHKNGEGSFAWRRDPSGDREVLFVGVDGNEGRLVDYKVQKFTVVKEGLPD